MALYLSLLKDRREKNASTDPSVLSPTPRRHTGHLALA